MPNTQSEKPDSQSDARDTLKIVPELTGRTEGSQPDCFVNRRSGFDPRGRLGEGNSEGAGEQAPADLPETAVTLSLEDRLYVAISRRGPQRIGQFIENAISEVGRPHECVFYFTDEWLVSAVESYADSLGRAS